MDVKRKSINASIQFYSLFPSQTDSIAVEAQLNDRFKGGSILMDDGDLILYICVFVFAVAFFYLNACFWWRIFDLLQVK